jgi:hypothetical protein
MTDAAPLVRWPGYWPHSAASWVAAGGGRHGSVCLLNAFEKHVDHFD